VCGHDLARNKSGAVSHLRRHLFQYDQSAVQRAEFSIQTVDESAEKCAARQHLADDRHWSGSLFAKMTLLRAYAVFRYHPKKLQCNADCCC
ncbi:hypothetical protein ACXKGW_28880, partial [Klebsiella pneumoniae subsp. pneumoniae]